MWNTEHLNQARKYCTELAQTHYENFPVGRWVSPELKPYVHAIYAFVRIADDFADEDCHHGQRLESLSQWRKALYEAEKGHAEHPVFIALADTIQKFQIPVEWLDQLICAFEQDVVKNRHLNFESLLEYARYSANPVGRLVLWLHGYRENQLFEWSDSICSALQFANFWQDVAIDWQKDRVYLPQDDMNRFGYLEEELKQGVVNENFCALLKFEIQRTWDLFWKGQALCDAVSGRLKIELRLIWLGGTRILERIEASNYDVFRRRPKLTFFDKGMMVWRTLDWDRRRLSVMQGTV